MPSLYGAFGLDLDEVCQQTKCRLFDMGLVQGFRQRRAAARLRREVEVLRQENARLVTDIKELRQDPYRIEAIARPENQGSVRVLERNGFQQFGHSRHSFELGGQWFDRLLFV